MTVEHHFDLYLKACYGDKQLDPIQLREVRQAFYGGSLIMFEIMDELSNKLSEEEAFKELDKLKQECMNYAMRFTHKHQ